MDHADSTSFLRHASRPLLTIARQTMPDLVISARFLKRGERNRLHALIAFGRVLREIVDPTATSDPDLEPDASDENRDIAPGCGCGTGSLDARLEVARNVIDYVYDHANLGRVGRIELDAFTHLQHDADLAREDCVDLATGMGHLAHTPRYPTAMKLHAALDDVARPAARLIGAVLVERNGDRPLAHDRTRPLVQSLGLAATLGRCLARLQVDLRTDRRVMVPLDDLVGLKLTDRDLIATARRGTPVPAAILALQRDRAHDWIPTIREIRDAPIPGRMVRMLATYAALWKRRFDEIGQGWSPTIPGDSLKEQIAALRESLWARHP